MNNKEIECPTGKCYFSSKGAIERYIQNRNKRNGGDRYRGYYCKVCGGYHLTTSNVIEVKMLMKAVNCYNRLDKKSEDSRLMRLYGLA